MCIVFIELIGTCQEAFTFDISPYIYSPFSLEYYRVFLFVLGHRSRVLRHHEDIIRIITKAQAHLNLKTITVIVIAIKGNAIIAATLANTNLTPLPKNPNVKNK